MSEKSPELRHFIKLLLKYLPDSRLLDTATCQALAPCAAKMRILVTGVIFSLLLTTASGAGEDDPRDSPVTCSSEGVVCEFGEDNLLDQVPESDCSLTVDGEEQQAGRDSDQPGPGHGDSSYRHRLGRV